ncbi:uncharacterized protein LOC120572873 isoform X1 [Perca fluviatilis]|nr:uncharacterized protein LOC120572873 isoform X1 [Perca fluviatilis]
MIEYCKLFLLVALWSVEVSNTAELRCPDTSLDAEVDKNVILQCLTVPKMDVSNKVEWVLNDTVDVHLLRNGKHEFVHQGKDYKDRTSLFDSELHTGNCSLRLKTKMTHTGRYRCSVRIGDETKHCFISLTVRPHELNPSDVYRRRDNRSSIHEKPTDGNNTGSTNTLSAGAIAGIIIAVIIVKAAIIIIIAGVICLPCHRPFEGVRQNDPDAPVAHNGPVQAVE